MTDLSLISIAKSGLEARGGVGVMRTVFGLLVGISCVGAFGSTLLEEAEGGEGLGPTGWGR